MKNKGIIKLILAVALICLFGVFALGSGESTETDQGSSDAQPATTENTNLGDFKVEIKECRLAKDYEGKDIIIVKYGFTNNADEPVSFMIALDDQVYQNGVGLNETIMAAESANYSSDNQMKDIKKGASLDVEVAYDLNDIETDIEVEVKESFSFDDSVVTKTFSIAE